MNNNFLSHIIRDLFPTRRTIVLYGDMHDLQKEMLTSIHSMGSFLLHTNKSHLSHEDNSSYWEIGINAPYMGYNYADLFVSINYSPEILSDNYDFIAEQIKSILKPGGFLFTVNSGKWSSKISDYLLLNNYLTAEAKRYSMLKDEQVFIYENI